MKHLFSLEEMRDVLELMIAAREPECGTAQERGRVLDRLTMYQEAVSAQLAALHGQVRQAEEFAADLGDVVARGAQNPRPA